MDTQQNMALAEKSRPVENAMNAQNAIIAELADAINRLELRITPILGANTPGPVNTEKSSNSDTSSYSTVFNVIDENNRRLSEFIYIINKLNERVEV